MKLKNKSIQLIYSLNYESKFWNKPFYTQPDSKYYEPSLDYGHLTYLLIKQHNLKTEIIKNHQFWLHYEILKISGPSEILDIILNLWPTEHKY